METIYTSKDITKILQSINLSTCKKKGIEYYNIICSFDIETSSFFVDSKTLETITITEYRKRFDADKKYNAYKASCMYVWQFAIEDFIVMGRTWQEFLDLCKSLNFILGLSSKRRLVIYVHNLGYEFQFIKDFFVWQDVFAIAERKPISVLTDSGLFFKCSLQLSAMSLDLTAKNLTTHRIEKLKGDLDYTLIRNSKTPLSDKEIGYCVNDVKIVVAYIREQVAQYGNLTKIPLTNTGRVRRFVRGECFKNKKYGFFIKELTLEPIEYQAMARAFSGGFTHCNAIYANTVLHDVTSYDFTSSYPTVMIAEKYPMSKGTQIEVTSREQFLELIEKYCCLYDVEITGLKPSVLYENILSYSKCWSVKNAVLNNGRIVSADSLKTTLTDVDYKNLVKFYKWDSFKVSNFWVYKKDYLPKEIITSILDLYEKKTTLKGVSGKENEYLVNKQMLNSIYGMSVTSAVRDTIIYDNDSKQWKTDLNNLNQSISEYNEDKFRFLFYAWGVWVTAYARYNLFTGIDELKGDYIYSDTDSVKCLNVEKHKEYFDRYNKDVVSKLIRCLKHYDIDPIRIAPKTIKGVAKPLGVWDFDGFYSNFKSLGAKRYLMTDKDNINYITVSGLAKKSALAYIEKTAENNGCSVYDVFSENMYVDCEHTGKNTHTYIDGLQQGIVTDYLGNTAEYSENASIHLMSSDYLLSLTANYVTYLLKIRSND